MARKTNGRESGPSTADNSAHEDVEMQDQDKIEGFKKFGVSGTRRRSIPSLRARLKACLAVVENGQREQTANVTFAVQSRHTRLHSTSNVTTRRPKSCADNRAGLGHTAQHHC